MAVKMTWVSVPTNYIPRFTIPDRTVNASAVKKFSQNVYDISVFFDDLRYIMTQAYGCFILENGNDIIYEKLGELYDDLYPVYEHYLELSELFVSVGISADISKIREICDAKRAEVSSKIVKIPGYNINSGHQKPDPEQTYQDRVRLKGLRNDLQIISAAEDGDYNGN